MDISCILVVYGSPTLRLSSSSLYPQFLSQPQSTIPNGSQELLEYQIITWLVKQAWWEFGFYFPQADCGPQLSAVTGRATVNHYLPVSSLETTSWNPHPAAAPGTWAGRSGPTVPVLTECLAAPPPQHSSLQDSGHAA